MFNRILIMTVYNLKKTTSITNDSDINFNIINLLTDIINFIIIY
jgi:hypothetical protein